MRLPKTISENSFDINFCLFVLCQLYVLLEFRYLLVVSAILTIISLGICALGILYLIELKHEDPEREIVFDIFKNLFLPLVLCITWVIIFDAYSTFYNSPLPPYYSIGFRP